MIGINPGQNKRYVQQNKQSLLDSPDDGHKFFHQNIQPLIVMQLLR